MARWGGSWVFPRRRPGRSCGIRDSRRQNDDLVQGLWGRAEGIEARYWVTAFPPSPRRLLWRDSTPSNEAHCTVGRGGTWLTLSSEAWPVGTWQGRELGSWGSVWQTLQGFIGESSSVRLPKGRTGSSFRRAPFPRTVSSSHWGLAGQSCSWLRPGSQAQDYVSVPSLSSSEQTRSRSLSPFPLTALLYPQGPCFTP